MKCSILCVGTELLLGQIDDTNSTYISSRLAELGINSYEKRVVGDNAERIADAVVDMLHSADCLIVTGGLGPTHDDITREVVADIMGAELIVDEKIVRQMRELFESRNREMSENNIRQAMAPVGAIALPNPLGTAPGLKCAVKVGGKEKLVYLTPGVPHEMKAILENDVFPDLQKNNPSSNVIVTRILKTWGLPESTLAQKLSIQVARAESSNVKLSFLTRGMNGIYIKLSISSGSSESAKREIAEVENDLKSIVGEYIYGYDDETMESIILKGLQATNSTIAIAESLTGGMLTSRLVDAPGTSDVLLGGVVSYATQIKRSHLGITADDIYSHECAEQMANAVRERFGSDFAISTTGVAGPDPIGEHKPGDVYVGLSNKEKTISTQFILGGDRKRVREYATISALNFFRQQFL